jgi:glycosyltransferase involved in cell wall biosynthesis
MTSVSIIIPAWNEVSTLEETLQALVGVDYDKSKCEVIIVAGGHDKTYETALGLSEAVRAFSRYVVILQMPEGKNAAIQQGLIEARNEIIVLLDADTIVSKAWLKSMLEPIEAGACDLTIANPEPVKKTWVSDYYMLIKTYFLDSITTFSGHSMAFRLSIVRGDANDFFDKRVKVGVDYFLAKKFLERGHLIMFSKKALVKTHLASSLTFFVLCELRWLTARMKIDGVSYKALGCNAVVFAALVSVVPICKVQLVLSVIANGVYIRKRLKIFFGARRHYKTRAANVFGFLFLSYLYHIIGLISYIGHVLRLSRKIYLYQGQRN